MTPGISVWHRTHVGGQEGKNKPQKTNVSPETLWGICDRADSPLRWAQVVAVPSSPAVLALHPSCREISLFFLSSNAVGFAGLAEGWKRVSAASARRDRQMFRCSSVPKNNSLVWERALRSAGPGTEAASPSSINSCASSTNLRLCRWVVSALAGDGNLETDFYSLGEVSFPPRVALDETSWAGVSGCRPPPAPGEQSCLSSAGAARLPAGCTRATSAPGVVVEGGEGGGAAERCAGPSPTSAALGQGGRRGACRPMPAPPAGGSPAPGGGPALSWAVPVLGHAAWLRGSPSARELFLGTASALPPRWGLGTARLPWRAAGRGCWRAVGHAPWRAAPLS